MPSLNAIAKILSEILLDYSTSKINYYYYINIIININEKMTIATNLSVCCADGTIHELAQVSDEMDPCSV